MITLLTNQTANANGNSFPLNGHGDKAEDAVFMVQGTFSTGSVTLEVSPDNGTTWIQSGSALTAQGVSNVRVSGDMLVRAVLAGGTSEDISAFLAGVNTNPVIASV